MLQIIAGMVADGDDDHHGEPSWVAMAGTCRLWRGAVSSSSASSASWELGRGGVIAALKENRRGLDVSFAAMHGLCKFTAKDGIVADVVVYAVATNDVAMVQRARATWPRLRGTVVARNSPTLVKWMVEGAGAAVLRELRDWWGFPTTRKIIHAKLRSFDDWMQWGAAQYLGDVLFFMQETGVEIRHVRRSNTDLVADVVGMCGDQEEVVRVLRMLRWWGMTIRDVRGCNKASLWHALSVSPGAIAELAAWGLSGCDAALHRHGVVVEWARREGRADVVAALERHLGIFSGRGPVNMSGTQGMRGPRLHFREEAKRAMLEAAMRTGTGEDLRKLRWEHGMRLGDLYDHEVRELMVRLMASRFGSGVDLQTNGVLEELVEGWGLGKGWQGWILLREVMSRMSWRSCMDSPAAVQAYLERVLGEGWVLEGRDAWRD